MRSAAAVIGSVAPPGELSRRDEVQLLLKGLPKACDDAKEALLQGRRASRYYRARYGRGADTQRKHAETVAAMPSKADVQAWALSRCIRVSDPLDL